MFGKKIKLTCGVHISDSQIKIVEVAGKARTLKVVQQHALPLDGGSVKNGKIVDEKAVAERLESLVKKAGLQQSGANLSIPTSNVVLRRSLFSSLKDKELRNLIEVDLLGAAQLPFKNPVFDYVRLGAPEVSEETDGKKEEVLIFATPSDVVESYANVVERAGLLPLSVELGPLALLRLLNRNSMVSGQQLLQRFIVIDCETDHADISIFVQGIPVFFRTVMMNYQYVLESGNDMAEAYSRNLSVELGRILNYYKYSVSTDQEDIDRLYLTGNADWLDSLSTLLQNQFAGTIGHLPMDAVLQDVNMHHHTYAISLGLALKGA